MKHNNLKLDLLQTTHLCCLPSSVLSLSKTCTACSCCSLKEKSSTAELQSLGTSSHLNLQDRALDGKLMAVVVTTEVWPKRDSGAD